MCANKTALPLSPNPVVIYFKSIYLYEPAHGECYKLEPAELSLGSHLPSSPPQPSHSDLFVMPNSKPREEDYQWQILLINNPMVS